MIKTLKVEKLNGRFDYEFEFYEDLNIFIGHNGTGKTTLLKLIWFLTSGNLHRAISEIPFDSVSIDTSNFNLSMKMGSNLDQVKFVCEFTKEPSLEALLPLRSVERENVKSVTLQQEDDVRKINEQIAKARQSSLFYPTYRRIERHFGWDILREPLLKLASELSVGDHKFITAVSTYDVIELLKEKNAEISEGENRIDEDYKTLCKRWSMLTQLIEDIFSSDYDGISIADDLIFSFNNGTDIIPSANLSSGEKQLLGFLCHTAFSEEKTIFIDEPELSLHSDWRRVMLRLLKFQGTEKQFFVATHSTVHIAPQYPNNKHELLKP